MATLTNRSTFPGALRTQLHELQCQGEHVNNEFRVLCGDDGQLLGT